MAFRVQILGHSPAAAAVFVGLEREVTFELINNRLRLHDNVTPGGIIVPNEDQIAALISTLEGTLTANINVVDAAKINRSIITNDNEVLIGTAVNTAATLALAASTIMARLASGNLVAATPEEIRTLLNINEQDAFLVSIATLGTAAGKLIKTTDVDTAAEIDITSAGESIISAADAETQRTLLDVQTTAAINSAIDVGVAAGLESLIPAGTVMCFFQTAAPAGWTQIVTQNDKVFRVVSGDGGGSGGDWIISGVSVDGHVISAAEMPIHTHDVVLGGGAAVFSGKDVGNAQGQVGASSATGGDTAHAHNLTIDGTWRPAFIDVLIAAKD